MKKNKQAKAQATKKKEKVAESSKSTKSDTPAKVDCLDDDDQGFGGWLKSTDGMDTMKLFVLANSMVMLTTLAYPHIQTIFSTISEMIYGYDELY